MLMRTKRYLKGGKEYKNRNYFPFLYKKYFISIIIQIAWSALNEYYNITSKSFSAN